MQGDSTTAAVKVVSHPLRLRMLAVLRERVASPSDLAGELDEPIGNVSYHMRTLADFGAVELVRTEPRRGAVEHYYQAVTDAPVAEQIARLSWMLMLPSGEQRAAEERAVLDVLKANGRPTRATARKAIAALDGTRQRAFVRAKAGP